MTKCAFVSLFHDSENIYSLDTNSMVCINSEVKYIIPSPYDCEYYRLDVPAMSSKKLLENIKLNISSKTLIHEANRVVEYVILNKKSGIIQCLVCVMDVEVLNQYRKYWHKSKIIPFPLVIDNTVDSSYFTTPFYSCIINYKDSIFASISEEIDAKHLEKAELQISPNSPSIFQVQRKKWVIPVGLVIFILAQSFLFIHLYKEYQSGNEQIINRKSELAEAMSLNEHYQAIDKKIVLVKEQLKELNDQLPGRITPSIKSISDAFFNMDGGIERIEWTPGSLLISGECPDSMSLVDQLKQSKGIEHIQIISISPKNDMERFVIRLQEGTL